MQKAPPAAVKKLTSVAIVRSLWCAIHRQADQRHVVVVDEVVYPVGLVNLQVHVLPSELCM